MNGAEPECTLNPQDAERYAGKWIAVLDSNVIADGKNIEKVFLRGCAENVHRAYFVVRIYSFNG